MLSKSAKHAYEKGYFVYDGLVISPRGHIRKLRISYRYPEFKFRVDDKHLTVKAHQLAAWQKFGTDCIGSKVEVRHLDDNPYNFKLENIELGTKAQNMADKAKNKNKK